MADPTKKTSNIDAQMMAPLLSTMPPPSQLPPKFFVPEPTTSTASQPAETIDQQQANVQQENQYQENAASANQFQVNQQQYQQPSFTLQQPTQQPQQQINQYQERN
jgi:hypothetical protein